MHVIPDEAGWYGRSVLPAVAATMHAAWTDASSYPCTWKPHVPCMSMQMCTIGEQARTCTKRPQRLDATCMERRVLSCAVHDGEAKCKVEGVARRSATPGARWPNILIEYTIFGCTIHRNDGMSEAMLVSFSLSVLNALAATDMGNPKLDGDGGTKVLY